MKKTAILLLTALCASATMALGDRQPDAVTGATQQQQKVIKKKKAQTDSLTLKKDTLLRKKK